ncbi:MAG: 16S rRNA (guanine(527)-N(7))-methyltransferase RsmG [Gammaproteobacteria bacterium]
MAKPGAAPDRSRLLDTLNVGLAAAEAHWGLPLTEAQRRSLVDYVLLMAKWNRVDNLTAVTDPIEMVQRHLLDSLSLAPHLNGNDLADLGSGAGLPGIPLAIAFPDVRFTLIDTAAKRVRFMNQARAGLGLDNVHCHQARAEDFRPDQPFSQITSRAFTSLIEFVAMALPLLAPGGRILAMKGQRPIKEMETLVEQGLKVNSVPLWVPDEHAERCLVTVEVP